MNGRAIVLVGLWLFASAPAALAGSFQSFFDRDVLWKIVDNCLQDSGNGDYCTKCPAPLTSLLTSCADPSGWDSAELCRKSTEVWDKTGEFVALRDSKMCSCPSGFVHGLALPLRKVTGVEDPSKPAGIWQFAWGEAAKKIEKESILLAANPRSRRTQDQLHIHLVRLAEGARRKFLELRPFRVTDLSEVWDVAARHAAASGWAPDGYGVAVVYDATADGFLVATADDGLEKAFGAPSCGANNGR